MNEDRFTGLFIAALVTAASIYFGGQAFLEIWAMNSGALR